MDCISIGFVAEVLPKRASPREIFPTGPAPRAKKIEKEVCKSKMSKVCKKVIIVAVKPVVGTKTNRAPSVENLHLCLNIFIGTLWSKFLGGCTQFSLAA